jgi:hypothetical protein
MAAPSIDISAIDETPLFSLESGANSRPLLPGTSLGSATPGGEPPLLFGGNADSISGVGRSANHQPVALSIERNLPEL